MSKKKGKPPGDLAKIMRAIRGLSDEDRGRLVYWLVSGMPEAPEEKTTKATKASEVSREESQRAESQRLGDEGTRKAMEVQYIETRRRVGKYDNYIPPRPPGIPG